MIKGIFSTLSGKYANEKRLDMIANNLANAQTAGYKASRPIFNVVTAENDSNEPQKPQSTFVNIYDSYIQFSDAPVVETGNRLDLAIEGNGFFVVSTPGGPRYTRNGKFTLNEEKKLITMQGNPVVGQGGDITIDGKDISVGQDGSIYVDKTFVDIIKVVDFADKASMRPEGNALFTNTNSRAEEQTPDTMTVRQGYYESSNVNVMQELIDIIKSVRAYESYAKVDQLFDGILSKLVDMGRF